MEKLGENHPEIIKDKGINQRGDDNKTPLIRAVLEKNINMVRVLINLSADVSITDKDGKPPLIYAAETGNINIVKALLNADVNGETALTALAYAVEHGHIEIAKTLIEAHADTSVAAKFGKSALMYAATGGHIDVVNALLAAGVNVLAVEHGEKSALVHAAENRHANVVEVLLQKFSADDKVSAFMDAAKKGHVEVVEALLAAGIDVLAVDKNGKSALIYAAREGHLNVMKALLKSKDVTVADNVSPAQVSEDTQKMVDLAQNIDSVARSSLKQLTEALQEAASKNHSTICRRLIAIKADPNAKNEQGQTALDLAIICNAWLACKVLIDNGAIVTSANQEQIDRYLETLDLSDTFKRLFRLPCINPYIPEVFFNNRFQKLSEVASDLNLDNAQGIILFNIADEPLGPSYGIIMGEFSPEASTKCYAQLAEKLVVVRVRVDDANELSNTIRTVRTFLPDRIPLTNWVLMGHANNAVVQVGPHSLLTLQNEETMREVGSLIDPKAFIFLSGCGSAKTDENISKVFSRCVPEFLVFGSPNSVASFEYYPLSSHTIRVFPVYNTVKHGGRFTEVRAYRNGKLVIEETRGISEGSIKDSPSFHLKLHEMLPKQQDSE